MLELLDAADLNGRDFDFSQKLFSLASKYNKLRRAAERKYSGYESAEHLKRLDEDYDRVIDAIISQTESEIKATAKIFNIQVTFNNKLVEYGQKLGHTFGIPVTKSIRHDRDAFDESVKTLLQIMRTGITRLGATAKQYFLDGNSATEAKSFIARISRNDKELSDIDLLKAIIVRANSNIRNTVYSNIKRFTVFTIEGGI